MRGFLFFLFVVCQSREEYLRRIPNGLYSRFAGNSQTGHRPSGQRNPFGEAFEFNNKVYSPDFCKLDSDGDGQTNGFELGDECCMWSNSSWDSVLKTTGLSFPGDPASTSPRAACGCGSGTLVNCSCCSVVSTPNPLTGSNPVLYYYIGGGVGGGMVLLLVLACFCFRRATSVSQKKPRLLTSTTI